MNLFQLGDFKLHSGQHSDFKLECDALTDDDWECIAFLLSQRLPPFDECYGVPRGGLKLAEKMQKYKQTTTYGWNTVLFADDVFTTGNSLRAFAFDNIGNREMLGAVVFARTEPPDWIHALFTMSDVPK